MPKQIAHETGPRTREQGQAHELPGHALMPDSSCDEPAKMSEPSDEQFRFGIEPLLDGFEILAAVRDGSGKIIDFRSQYINEPGCRMTGRTAEECLSHPLLEVWPACRDEGIFDQYVRVIETGEPVSDHSIEYEYRDAGRPRVARAVNYRAVKLEDGLAVSYRDVTEQTRAEEELQQAHERLREETALLEQRVRERTATLSEREAALEETAGRLREANRALRAEIAVRKQAERAVSRQADNLQELANLLNLTHEAVLVRDIDGTIRFWNNGAMEIYGWTSEEAVGQRTHDLLDTRFGQPLGQINVDLLRNGRWEGEVINTRRDGLQVIAASRWVVHQRGKHEPPVVLEINTDITERKQAEETLARHTQRLEILHGIDRAILAAKSPQIIADVALRHLHRALRLARAGVLLFDPGLDNLEVLALDAVIPEVLYPGRRLPRSRYRLLGENRLGRVAVVEDLAQLPDLMPEEEALLAAGLRCFTGVPLMVSGQLVGVLLIGRPEPKPLPQESLELVVHVADSLAVVIHNARLFEQVRSNREQLQSLSRRLVEALEDERRTIARELHDEAGQALTAMRLGLGQLLREAGEPASLSRHVEELQEVADDVMEELHHLALNLRPASLDRFGLLPALRQYVDSFERQCNLEVELVTVGLESERLPPEVETAVYRVVQEGLTNVMRHAQATRAGVVVERHLDRAVAIIEDNGLGFDVETALCCGRLGLLGMRERAEMLGGSIEIESRLGQGTSLFVEIPLQSGNLEA